MGRIRTAFLIGLFLLCLAAANFGQEKDPGDFTAHLVGHAHIDLSWLWRWEETVHDVAFQTFKGTLAQMDKMPGLTFAQSQAAIYEAIEKYYPDLFKAIQAKVKAGTWLPVGGMWVEPDLNMPDGESLARQLLYGKRYFLDKFGVDVKVGWNPDSFGHNWQLPQIMAKAGLKYYIFERCAPDKTLLFQWQGMDGSKILSYVPPGWYLVGLKNGTKDVIFDAAKNSSLMDYMLLYGEGDHGGGPRDSDLEAIKKFKKDKGQPRTKFVAPEDYFKLLESQKLEIPVFNNELNFTFPACYTTQAQTKKNNRKSESLLLSAEKFSALAVASGYRDYYPERDLDEAWKIVLRNQFHDILDGSSIGPVYDEVNGFYQAVFDRGRRALNFSLESISNSIDTRGEGLPLVVYNPLFWERTEPVVSEFYLLKKFSAFKLLDAQGAAVPFQVITKEDKESQNLYRIVFIAENIPSFGYKLYRIAGTDKAPEFKSNLVADANSLENEYFKVRLNSATGWLESIFDKADNREILGGQGNVLQAIVDEPESMSAWELGLKDQSWNIGEEGAKAEVVEAGPVRAVVRVKSLFRNSAFGQDIILYNRIPRIDFRLSLNWQERNLMIKAAFPLNVKNGKADFEIPFGAVSRPAEGREVPALRWVDLSDESGGYGVSLLNDCKYGFDVKNNTIRLSVIHGATNPDPEADRGPHELLYSLYPHRGTWKDALTVQRGYEFNTPLMPRVAMAHPGPLPASQTFVSVGPDNIILTSLKKEMGYYYRGLILRLYEAFGKKTEAKIELPWPVDAWVTDLIERPGKKIEATEKTVTLSFEPYEIKTIRIVRKPGP
jgi:alpha-mannosidase